MDDHSATCAANVVGYSNVRSIDLPFTGIASELLDDLYSLLDPCCAYRMSTRLKPAARVNGYLTANSRITGKRYRASCPFFEESQIFNCHYFSDSKAVVHFSDIDL